MIRVQRWIAPMFLLVMVIWALPDFIGVVVKGEWLRLTLSVIVPIAVLEIGWRLWRLRDVLVVREIKRNRRRHDG